MRRAVGLVAAGLGTFLLVSGLLLRFYVAAQVVKFPLNEYQVTTLSGKNVTYFSPGLLKDVAGVNMRVTRTIEGDVAAGTSSRAVWVLFSYIYDATHGVAYKALTQRSAFDRRSGALAGCCGEAVGGYTGRQSGLAFTWPIGTQQRSYQIFDTTLLRPMQAQFDGQASIDGLRAYRFVERVPAQKFSTQKLPAALVGLHGQPTVTLDEYYQATNTYWVDPVTGAVLDINENQKITLRDSNGVQRLVLFQGDLPMTAQSVQSSVRSQRGRRAGIEAITLTVPLGLGLAGVVFLAAGALLVLWRRAPGDVPAEPEYAMAEPAQ
jgi:Porin PorA